MKSMRYTGPSMKPILENGDRLEVIPYEGRGIRRGDVIVFRHPQDGHMVVHRVIGQERGKIRTCGDNTWPADDWLLNPADVIGYVVSAQRGRRRKRIYGGGVGSVLAFALRILWVLRIGMCSLLRPVYLQLAKAGVFRRCFRVVLKTRIVSFKRPSGVQLQLFMGGRMIGICPAGESRWKIRPPFKLFVDETTLPLEIPSEPTSQEQGVSFL